MRGSDESLIAYVTAIWFLACVGALVSLQCCRPAETLGTVLTLVGAFSCVFKHVSLQVTIFSKGFGTQLTFVRFIVTVC